MSCVVAPVTDMQAWKPIEGCVVDFYLIEAITMSVSDVGLFGISAYSSIHTQEAQLSCRTFLQLGSQLSKTPIQCPANPSFFSFFFSKYLMYYRLRITQF
jgi:hypothetical protein